MLSSLCLCVALSVCVWSSLCGPPCVVLPEWICVWSTEPSTWCATETVGSVLPSRSCSNTTWCYVTSVSVCGPQWVCVWSTEPSTWCATETVGSVSPSRSCSNTTWCYVTRWSRCLPRETSSPSLTIPSSSVSTAASRQR